MAEFRDILARVSVGPESGAPEVLEIDGGRGFDEVRSYRVAGRVIVARSDVMLAVWNGTVGEGRGGTWDTMLFALQRGVPLIVVDAEGDRSPRWVTSLVELRRPAGEETEIVGPLADHLARMLPPPARWSRRRHGIFDRLAFLRTPLSTSLEKDFLAERPLPERRIWLAHRWFMRWAARGATRAAADPTPAATAAAKSGDDPVYDHWRARMSLPDRLATDYAERYRSAYVWVFALAAVSVTFGASALVVAAISTGLPEVHSLASEIFHAAAAAAAGAELLLLFGVLLLVVLVRRREWHEKSIEYRLLAELCRKECVLAPLGWTLPISSVRSAVGGHQEADRATWVAWLFAADQRVAPFPKGELVIERHRNEIGELVAGQLAYHSARRTSSAAAGHRLETLGLVIFMVILAAVVGKLLFGHALHMPWVALGFGWTAIVLPGFSAGFVGIRAYAELQLLAAQSSHMIETLTKAQAAVAAIDPTAPLVSNELGTEAAALAGIMLQDLEGWARLFRLKVAELG